MLLLYFVIGLILAIVGMKIYQKKFPESYKREFHDDYLMKFGVVVVMALSWIIVVPLAIICVLFHGLFKFLKL